jgi:hypothetical protein
MSRELFKQSSKQAIMCIVLVPEGRMKILVSLPAGQGFGDPAQTVYLQQPEYERRCISLPQLSSEGQFFEVFNLSFYTAELC